MNEEQRYGLGALESPPDKRDILLGKLQPDVQYPDEYISPLPIEALYQNGYPMCGAYSGAHLIASFDSKETNKIVKISPNFIWKDIKSFDGYSPESGTDLRSIFKSLTKSGGCDYDLLPTNYSESLESITRYDITDAQKENAHQRILSDSGYGVGYDIDGLKKDIYLYGYGIVLLPIGDTWWGNSQVIPYSKFDGRHFVLVYGYDKDGVFILDSADNNVPKKHLSNDCQIVEYRCAFDCENWKITVMKKQIFLLKQLAELMTKLANMKKVVNQHNK
jgi:hypothetical protein